MEAGKFFIRRQHEVSGVACVGRSFKSELAGACLGDRFHSLDWLGDIEAGGEMKRLTPIKAMRARCLDCSGFSCAEVRDCEFTDCSLYLYRAGHRAKEKTLRPLKAIRKYCIWCCGDQSHEVKLCPAMDCPLNYYRFGKSPHRKKDVLNIEPQGQGIQKNGTTLHGLEKQSPETQN